MPPSGMNIYHIVSLTVVGCYLFLLGCWYHRRNKELLFFQRTKWIITWCLSNGNERKNLRMFHSVCNLTTHRERFYLSLQSGFHKSKSVILLTLKICPKMKPCTAKTLIPLCFHGAFCRDCTTNLLDNVFYPSRHKIAKTADLINLVELYVVRVR